MWDRLLLILTRWPFIVVLAVLLLNDWWLKSQYPGVITGKLSDFSGLAVVAMLLLAVFPSRTATIYIILKTAVNPRFVMPTRPADRSLRA